MATVLDPDSIASPFGLSEDLPALDADWHHHRRPQLLYAVSGAMRLYTETAVAVLPPNRAAWIPGGCRHRVSCGRPVSLRTVYFDLHEDGGDVQVFEAPPLLREMAVTAAGWGAAPPAESASFFDAFRWLVDTWRQIPLPVSLPMPQSAALVRATSFILDRLAHPIALVDIAAAAGLTQRTLQRHFRAQLGVGVAVWMTRARLMHALDLLSDPDLSIGEVALRCGYASPAAFSRVFSGHLGSAPSAWRQSRRPARTTFSGE